MLPTTIAMLLTRGPPTSPTAILCFHFDGTWNWSTREPVLVLELPRSFDK